MSLSLREEVKLNQTENAWVPTAVKKATKNDPKNKDEEVLKTEVNNLYELIKMLKIFIYLTTYLLITLMWLNFVPIICQLL